MAEFSPADAALEGFRTAKENPGAIAIWSVLQLVVSVALIVGLIRTAGPEMTALMAVAMDTSGTPDTERMAAAITALTPKMGALYAVILPISIIYRAFQASAVMRAVLRPQDRGLGYLKFSMDELRVGIVLLVISLLLGLAATAAMIAVGVVSVMLGAFGILLGFIGFLLIVAAIIYASVKLSLAVPQTFAERRFAFFGSWALTKGRFWPLLGCYLIAIVLMIVVFILGSIVNAAAMAIGGGSSIPDMSSVEAYFTPAQIVSVLAGAVVGALAVAILNAPSAVIYARLTGKGAADSF